jgi:pilus assembly protein CpaF
MFGRRNQTAGIAPAIDAGIGKAAASAPCPPPYKEDTERSALPTLGRLTRSGAYHEIKKAALVTLIDSIDLGELAKLSSEEARRELREVAGEIVRLAPAALPLAEREDLLEDICDEVLGFGPLEPLLAQDGITDIMINGARECYIEVSRSLWQLTQ